MPLNSRKHVQCQCRVHVNREAGASLYLVRRLPPLGRFRGGEVQ